MVNHTLDEAGLSQSDYVKAALRWQYNWIGLAGAAAFAVMSGTGIPIVLAAGLEMMYVALVPQSSRFRRLVRSWKYAEQKREHQRRLDEMCHNLPPELQSRYSYMKQVIQGIRNNYAQLSYVTQGVTGQMETKLAGLLESYVRLLYSGFTHRDYLKSLNPDQVRKEAEYLEKDLSKEPPKVQEINQKRIEILRKRLQKFQKIQENRQVIDAQCAAVEDVLQLIRDQSVTMRDPQEVSAQLDHLVDNVEQTEQSVREMEEIFSISAPDATTEDLTLPAADEAPRPRNRVTN
jgi:myosin heavy subunit